MSSDGVDGRDDLSVSDTGEYMLVAEKVAVYRSTSGNGSFSKRIDFCTAAGDFEHTLNISLITKSGFTLWPGVGAKHDPDRQRCGKLNHLVRT